MSGAWWDGVQPGRDRSHAQLVAAQRSLLDSEKILRSILNSMSDGVAAADPTGRFLMIHPAAEPLFGGAADSVSMGASEVQVFRTDETTAVSIDENPLTRALRGETVPEQEPFLRSPTLPGGLHVSVSASPLRGDGDEVAGGAVVLRDISGRRVPSHRSRTDSSQAGFPIDRVGRARVAYPRSRPPKAATRSSPRRTAAPRRHRLLQGRGGLAEGRLAHRLAGGRTRSPRWPGGAAGRHAAPARRSSRAGPG